MIAGRERVFEILWSALCTIGGMLLAYFALGIGMKPTITEWRALPVFSPKWLLIHLIGTVFNVCWLLLTFWAARHILPLAPKRDGSLINLTYESIITGFMIAVLILGFAVLD